MSQLYQFLPPLSADEREALRESIATFGVLQAVITDETGNVLDGHHRAEIAAELGIEYPTKVRIRSPNVIDASLISSPTWTPQWLRSVSPAATCINANYGWACRRCGRGCSSSAPNATTKLSAAIAVR